jgi:RNA polymerase sigma factor (sigma-70 family)
MTKIPIRLFSMTDAEILDRIQKGDEKVLEYLYKKYFKMMSNIVMKNNGTEDEAKDIFQDALIVFWQKVSGGSFVLTSRVSTFLYSVCYNLWLKELDRKSRFTHEERDNADPVDYDRQERIKAINDCIAKLGETCRLLLSYYYFDELSMIDIAERMGFANADSVKSKKYKCKQELDKLVKTKFKVEDFLD